MCVCVTRVRGVPCVSYKAYLPRNVRAHIQRYNILTRKRIRRRFSKFIHRFQDCKAAVRDLQLKYLMCLETLLPSLHVERFRANEVTIVVTGNKGIQWFREKEAEPGEEVSGRGRGGRRYL